MTQILNVLLVTDHSISMQTRASAAMEDYNRIIRTLKDQSDSTGLTIRVTHIQCGIRTGWGDTGNHTEFIDRDIKYVEFMTSYQTNGSCTPLFDAAKIGFGYYPNTQNPCLALIITDGQDNASNITGTTLGRTIQTLQATDKWTITFSVPRGYKSHLVSVGVPSDNIQEWELSSAGMETASIARSASLSNYTASVASGSMTSTSKFYTDLSNVSQSQIKAVLKDI